jgi:hypothetical protein
LTLELLFALEQLLVLLHELAQLRLHGLQLSGECVDLLLLRRSRGRLVGARHVEQRGARGQEQGRPGTARAPIRRVSRLGGHRFGLIAS